MKLPYRPVLALAALTGLMQAQTAVDLRAQSRNVDFSSATATKPFKTGAVLPSVCATGESFFKTDAPAGRNVYVCVASNTWNQLAGLNAIDVVNSGPGAVEILKSQAAADSVIGRQMLTGEGMLLTQQDDTVAVEVDTAVTPRYATAAAAPTGACQTGRDQYVRTAGFPHIYACVDSVWKPVYEVTSTAPATCYSGELYFDPSSAGVYGCIADNTWRRLNSLGVDLSTAGHCFITYACSMPFPAVVGPLPEIATEGRMTAVRVVIPFVLKLYRGLLYSAAGSSAHAFAAAVYTDNNDSPGTKIPGSDLRVVDLNASAYKHGIWGEGDVVLTPGLYWIGFSSESATAWFHYAGGGPSTMATMLAQLVKPGVVACSNLATGTGSGYILPDTCGTATAATTLLDPPVLLSAAQ